ncbi:DUF305 domain-containing protein [Plantactinospora sp. S1510]|uniref:DUF305 domain-containing protein n=1 Tax=Plantactinospora alkalitolerans TaxID=2789879 RepID=A0ABS0H6S5_9ACTN|nr:DUF305 domain-containing protein [Plantactinospora alkalitolerans]MBF9133854.1 DUF305 domain-containing protein [Plantactinospora alkalitolerans]
MTGYRRTLIVATLLLLGGCASTPDGTGAAPAGPAPAPTGSAAPAPADATGAFNETDVMFLQMMVTHHGQGLELVRLVESRARRTEVKTLAAAIDVTQDAERETMRNWLTGWGRTTSADPDAHAHADHGGLPATGPKEIAALARTTGTEFETAFLNLLIAHQHNAVEMARVETRSGAYPGALDLARRIDLSRTAQINQMLALLPPATP